MGDQTIADVQARLEAVRDGSRLGDVYAGQPEQFRSDLTALLASHRRMKEALEKADAALRNHACHGPGTPCVRSEDQCDDECGFAAGDALMAVISAIQGDAHEDR